MNPTWLASALQLQLRFTILPSLAAPDDYNDLIMWLTHLRLSFSLDMTKEYSAVLWAMKTSSIQ